MPEHNKVERPFERHAGAQGELFARREAMKLLGARGIILTKQKLFEQMHELQGDIDDLTDELNGYGIHSLEDEEAYLTRRLP